MTRDLLAITLRGIEALNAGDLPAILELIDRDVELLPALVGGIEQTVYRGHDGYRRWFEEQRSMYDVVAFENIETCLLDGERVLAVYDVRVRGKGSGIEMSQPWAVICTFRDGLVVKQVGYRDQAQARADAALA